MSRMLIVDRLESMSPDGMLRLYIEPDNDVIIEVRQTQAHGHELTEPRIASVQICTAAGGGGSPKTIKALWELAEAMAEDNADPHSGGRRGENLGTEMLPPKPSGQIEMADRTRVSILAATGQDTAAYPVETLLNEFEIDDSAEAEAEFLHGYVKKITAILQGNKVELTGDDAAGLHRAKEVMSRLTAAEAKVLELSEDFACLGLNPESTMTALLVCRDQLRKLGQKLLLIPGVQVAECICPPHCHDECCPVCIAGLAPGTPLTDKPTVAQDLQTGLEGLAKTLEEGGTLTVTSFEPDGHGGLRRTREEKQILPARPGYKPSETFLLHYADPDREDEHFAGESAERAAKLAYGIARQAWSVTLFQALDSNT